MCLACVVRKAVLRVTLLAALVGAAAFTGCTDDGGTDKPNNNNTNQPSEPEEPEEPKPEPEKPKVVHLDRPFVYMIIDCENAVPLFMGILGDTNQ